jgi:hypothetical protein
MPIKANPLPRSFMSFYFSLFKRTFTEAYGAIDSYLTFIAAVLFLVALFNKELAHRVETNWQGLSRWYSIIPLGALLTYRVMRANYAHFENAVEDLDSIRAELRVERDHIQQPDVALVWDWPEDQRKAEKLMIVHNRSDQYVYNIKIAPIKLSQEMTFNDISEIGPGSQHLTVARWDGRSSVTTNYVYFFGKEENEKEASSRGWVHRKLHNSGISEFFFEGSNEHYLRE